MWVGENILRDVHSFVSTFSVELFLSKLFLVGQGFTWTIPSTALLTYTSLVLRACCFLAVITSDIQRSHRQCGVWKWWVLVCNLKVTVLAKIILRQHFLPCPCCLEWKHELVYFDNCQEDRTPNKCRRWNLSYLERFRNFVIGFIS